MMAAPWNVDYVIKNKFSRPGTKNDGVDGIVMHWTATPGASDTNEQKFFDGEDGGGSRYASAHLFVDRDSATLILPLDEVGYHANDHACRLAFLKPNANFTSIGIEMCVEKDGTIHPETVERSAQVAAELCRIYKLDPLSRIVRHYDVTGKNCPAPWVKDVNQLVAFKNRVNALVKPAAKPVVEKKPAAASKPAASAKPAVSKLTAPNGVYRSGSKGAAIAVLQKCLNAVNFNCGTPDGHYGLKTQDAVRRFQSVYCNPADGVYGPKTQAALQKQLNK